MATIIGEPQPNACSEVALHRQVPLLDIGILIVNVLGLEKRLLPRLRQIGREWIGESQRRVPIGDRLVVGPIVSGVNAPLSGKDGAEWTLNELSITAADYGLAVGERPPCE